MSARKLSRFAGLVFVLAAFFGGGGAYVSGAEHETGGSSTVTNGGTYAPLVPSGSSTGGTSFRTFDYDWV
jgi:hypothetical protein